MHRVRGHYFRESECEIHAAIFAAALMAGQDPNSYFVADATASEFLACVEQARGL
jgi:hypothetical protein